MGKYPGKIYQVNSSEKDIVDYKVYPSVLPKGYSFTGVSACQRDAAGDAGFTGELAAGLPDPRTVTPRGIGIYQARRRSGTGVGILRS